jgi:hypothetical protein
LTQRQRVLALRGVGHLLGGPGAEQQDVRAAADGAIPLSPCLAVSNNFATLESGVRTPDECYNTKAIIDCAGPSISGDRFETDRNAIATGSDGRRKVAHVSIGRSSIDGKIARTDGIPECGVQGSHIQPGSIRAVTLFRAIRASVSPDLAWECRAWRSRSAALRGERLQSGIHIGSER